MDVFSMTIMIIFELCKRRVSSVVEHVSGGDFPF